MPSVCQQCGNNHYGACATEETTFIWSVNPKEQPPTEVMISGSWKQWQTVQKLSRDTLENGDIYFRISLTLLTGTYEYKFIVDGEWLYDPKSPMVDDQHGSFNNVIKVFPKKMFVPVNKEGLLKLTTNNVLLEGLMLTGSWDGWQSETPMIKSYNHLKGCEECVGYVKAEPDQQYEFLLKFGHQYLIEETYPTTLNEFNSHNNIIISYSEVESKTTQPSMDTPKYRSYKHSSYHKEFACKHFKWTAKPCKFEMPYKRVAGHSMVFIGDYLYIFGGYCRSEFYNSLTKINFQLQTARSEDALPNGRAFHSMVSYGSKIIVFGGHNTTLLQDYYSFNVSEEKWMAIPRIEGKNPEKRQKQSCVIYDMLMVFFGGYYCSPDFEYEAYYKDISVLDIEQMKWVDPIEVKGQQPIGRFAHSASLVGTYMYIFGGIYNAVQNLNLNDIWKINLQKVNELSWVEVKPKGVKPRPRHGHTMNTLHHYLIVFGGIDLDGIYLNDIFIFNTHDNEWFEPEINKEDIPRPRAYHAATMLHNDELVVFGGKTQNHKQIENIYLLKPTEPPKLALPLEEQEEEVPE